MPIEEYRHLYLGVVDSHTHVYMGHVSAALAKWMYDKLGLTCNILKTDILVNVDDYTYLHNIDATILETNEYVIRDIKLLLEGYDVIRTRKANVPSTTIPAFLFTDSLLMEDKVCVFYNHTTKMTIVLHGNTQLSSSTDDSIITMTKDMKLLGQFRLYPTNQEKFVSALADSFDKKRFVDFAAARMRMAEFKLNVPL